MRPVFQNCQGCRNPVFGDDELVLAARCGCSEQGESDGVRRGCRPHGLNGPVGVRLAALGIASCCTPSRRDLARQLFVWFASASIIPRGANASGQDFV